MERSYFLMEAEAVGDPDMEEPEELELKKDPEGNREKRIRIFQDCR